MAQLTYQSLPQATLGLPNTQAGCRKGSGERGQIRPPRLPWGKEEVEGSKTMRHLKAGTMVKERPREKDVTLLPHSSWDTQWLLWTIPL